MASIQFNITEFEYEKPRAVLIIPSNDISRVCSPMPNFLEVPKSKDLELSFMSTFSQLPENSEKGFIAEEEALEMLKELKGQLRMINEKLDKNLGVIKDVNANHKSRIQTEMIESVFEGNGNGEIYCSCSKQCELF